MDSDNFVSFPGLKVRQKRDCSTYLLAPTLGPTLNALSQDEENLTYSETSPTKVIPVSSMITILDESNCGTTMCTLK